MELNIEKIRSFFMSDRFAMNAGIVIDAVESGSVTCSMPVTAAHLNAAGGVQGGAIFTLADFTFGVHANLECASGEETGMTVGQSCAISFLKLAKGKKLIATSTCLSKGRHISVYRISVTDDLGNFIAEMHGNGFTIHKKV
ncbi:MAG: PaaI family thioesterase [Clostridiales bacterium]|nr:PaaI family thioesterase [Clostridiales bacterium]